MFLFLVFTHPSLKHFLASFGTHRPPEHFLKGDAESESTLTFKKFASELGSQHRMLTAENNRFLYEGKSHLSSRNSKYILGFCTGKSVKFVDVDQVFPMSQIIKKRIQPEQKEKVNTATTETYFEKRAHLNEDFGTKKSKKKIASMMTNIVEVILIHHLF